MAKQRIPNAPETYNRSMMQQVLWVIQTIVDRTDSELRTLGTQVWDIQDEDGTEYTLGARDGGRYLRFTADTQIDVTISVGDASVVGASIRMVQIGDGQVVLTPDSGVTVNTADGLRTRQQFSDMWLTKVGEDEWDLSGDLVG